MDRAVVLLVSGASATLHVPFVLHLFGCISLHMPFICMHLPFIVHSFPFISFHFLSLVFISIHFPFIFLSCSFQCAFMSSHLPFMCTQVPFILHSCPFISFLKLWRWLSGLAREPLQHMTLFEGNLPQNDRPRERERAGEREREQVGCQMLW